jgi:glycosyltransferase involved in cell wall biosynthesis
MRPTSMPRSAAALIMIGYEIDVGFAIGRLVRVFHEMARRVTGPQGQVHFSFARIGSAASKDLPADFANLLEFDMRKPSPEAVARLGDYVRQHRIDWVFALDLSVSATFLPALRAAGVKRIVSYWGAPMSSLNRGLKLLLKRLEVTLLRRARPDRFIFESRAMQRFAVEGRGLPAAQTTVIPTGVDAGQFRPGVGSAALVYERFNIPRERRIVVYMGHLHARKGVHVLMRAAGHLLSVLGRRDIHVLFLGNRGDEVAKFREDWATGEQCITFGGYQGDVPVLLSGCYAGCIPSTGWDSFPMSSLEMQACGLPVLVSDWQGVPETVADGQTGIVVAAGDAPRLADAIAALVDDPERRQRMSAAARARIEEAFTREHQIENLVRYLQQQGL